jgi:transketolase
LIQYNKLQETSASIRLDILDAIASANKGHIGGAFSSVELLVALFHGGLLKYDSDQPDWPGRDYFFLSKGHAGVVLYSVLASIGYLKKEQLMNLNQEGLLGEHPDFRIPGVEADSGSLGHGLGIATGLASSHRMDKKDNQTVVLLGDGECYEGSTWEAALFAAHLGLNNLFAIVDRNRQIVNDFTEGVNRLEPLGEKWSAFGWEVREINGHDFKDIFNAFHDFRIRKSTKPVLILANTVKGKGVSFMEGKLEWHHGAISGDKLRLARQEITIQLSEYACE